LCGGRRPHFGSLDTAALLETIGEARGQSTMCGSAAGYGTPLHRKCEALRRAIDDLAGELTGDREYFWPKPAVSLTQRRD
jgi:hypothetical protein